MTRIPEAPRPREGVELHFTEQIQLTLENGELWWGGAIDDGCLMPFGPLPFKRDLGQTDKIDSHKTMPAPSNQSSPLLLSTRGRVIWSERPFAFEFDGEHLTVTGGEIVMLYAGSTLRDAYRAACERFFTPSGRKPAAALFTGPQYNTWIEQPYRPTQAMVLGYVRDLLDAGMPPGVVIIDDSWAIDYGTWRFDSARFPDPAGMTAQLHEWGCSVMLWLVPFVSPDSATFRELESRGLLIRDRFGSTAVRRWWNGLSAVLDLTNQEAINWLISELDMLVDHLGVDGFKFDGGDVRDYRTEDLTANPAAEPVDMCQAWAELGLRYPFNEFRACWRMGGQPLGQRLQDKPPFWDERGIKSLIPEMLAQGLIGHPFTCPDLIGGGEIEAVRGRSEVDQEFFVRYTQIAALSPMMQFSASPVRVLDEEHLTAVNAALAIRNELLPTILELVDTAARTGEPIVRPLAYHETECDDVTDQFFLGPDIIVAPVLDQGATMRRVVLPAGRWRDDAGTVVVGPRTIAVACGLLSIPRFHRIRT